MAVPPPPTPPPSGRPSLIDRALRWRWRPDPLVRLVVLLGVPSIVITALIVQRGEHFADSAGSAPPGGTIAPAHAPVVQPASLLAALARAMPPGAKVARLAAGDEAGLSVTIETPEPDRLRAALSGDPLLAGLRTRGEAALADGGYRVTLETGE